MTWIKCGALLALLGTFAGCSNVDRSLVFFTGTTVGVEVSADAASNTPVKAIVGYKRAEGVLNPVYDEEGTNDPEKPGKKYRDEAYSVIAKIAGSAEASGSGNTRTEVSGAQWFATGQAAKTLAEQPGIAGMVSGSSEIQKQTAKQVAASFGTLSTSAPLESSLFLSALEQMLGEIAKANPGGRAALVHTALNAEVFTSAVTSLQLYKIDGTPAANGNQVLREHVMLPSTTVGLTAVNRRLDELRRSRERLKAALANTAGFSFVNSAGATLAIDPLLKAGLEKAVSDHEAAMKKIGKALEDNKLVQEAIQIVAAALGKK